MSSAPAQFSGLSRTESKFLALYFEARWSEFHGQLEKAEQKLLDAAEVAENGGYTLATILGLHSVGILAYETATWDVAEHAFIELGDLARGAHHGHCEAISLLWRAKISEARGGHGKDEYEQAADVFESTGEADKAQTCRDAGSDSFLRSMIQPYPTPTVDGDEDDED